MLLSEFEIVFTFLLYFIVLCNFMEQEANKNHLNLQPAMSHLPCNYMEQKGNKHHSPCNYGTRVYFPSIKKELQ